MSYKLTWEPNPKADSQEIYRSTQQFTPFDPPAPMAVAARFQKEFEDSSILPWTRYWYSIGAIRTRLGFRERSLTEAIAIGYTGGKSLGLGFSNQNYEIDPNPKWVGEIEQSTFSGLLNFTRASVATYIDANGILQTASVNEPRFAYDPMTGLPLGLLIEGAATNLLKWSQDASNVAWGTRGVTKGVSDIVLPFDGGGFGHTITENTGVSVHDIYQLVPTTTGEHSQKVLIHPRDLAGRNFFLTIFGSSSLGNTRTAYFSETGQFIGIIGGTGSYVNPIVTELSGGWLLIDWSATSTADGNAGFYVGFFNNSNTFDGNGVSKLHIGFMQGNPGKPTSYIKTEGAQATRAADVCSRTMGAEYRADEGTVYVEGIVGPNNMIRGVVFLCKDGQTTTTRSFAAIIGATNRMDMGMGGAYISNPFGLTLLQGDRFKLAIASHASGYRACLNGVFRVGPQKASLGIDKMYVGAWSDGSTITQARSTIANTYYIPRALSQTELQALTTL